MNELNEKQMNESEENIDNKSGIITLSAGDDLWYDFTPPSNLNCTAKYRRLSNQNILQVYVNGNNNGGSGSIDLGTLPERFRPSKLGIIAGMISMKVNGEIVRRPQLLNIAVKGQVEIPAMNDETIKSFIFYGMIDL